MSILACVGCGPSDEAEVAACRARTPTIEAGVFGCTTTTSDVGTPVTKVLPGFAVEIFVAPPPPAPGDGLRPLLATRSDAAGFFELPLSPGHYWICTSFRRCREFDAASSPVRRDYDFGPGPG